MKPRILRVWYSHRLDTQSCPQPHQAELLKLWRTGQFNYWGIQCKALLGSKGQIFTLATQGAWGVRGDHPWEIKHVEDMEGQQMRGLLRNQGLGERAIEYAFRKIETMKEKTP